MGIKITRRGPRDKTGNADRSAAGLGPWLRKAGGPLLAVGLAAALTACAAIDPSLSPSAPRTIQEEPGDEPPPLPPGPLTLTVEEAIWMGLQRNRALRVEQLSPEIRRTREMEERALFDPQLSGSLSQARDAVTPRAEAGFQAADPLHVRRRDAALGLEHRLPTGTLVGLETLYQLQEYSADRADAHVLGAGVSVTQPLLRGAGLAVNRAAVRQAEIDTRISAYELRAFVESFVAQVESVYWDYVLALRRVEIVRESADLAEKQLREVERRIEVGALAASERAAAQAESALRREALINAQSVVEQVRLRFLRLLNPGDDWECLLNLVDEPRYQEPDPEPVAERVRRASGRRPELLQARLALERGELEVVRTRNGLLPRMDLFVRLGRTGYAESFSGASDALGEGDLDWNAGVRVAVPLGLRAERARHERGRLGLEQSRLALKNLEQLVELDVRTAVIEWRRSAAQISATAATRAFQEESLRAEEEKFRVGKSTSLLVAQAQRDVLVGRISEVESVVQFLQALSNLYRLEGTLLDRRGIDVPAVHSTSSHENEGR